MPTSLFPARVLRLHDAYGRPGPARQSNGIDDKLQNVPNIPESGCSFKRPQEEDSIKHPGMDLVPPRPEMAHNLSNDSNPG